MKKGLIFVTLFFLLIAIAQGQSFSSGSTGADGALNLAAMSCTTCEIQLPESGVLNYTTVNVSAGKTLKFKRNLRNTPVIMLAQGNTIIAGTIDISAPGCPSRDPGPGGFAGGADGQPGLGPGCCVGFGSGQWVGLLSLVPIVGGSGQKGGFGFYGAGGGGAIVIASSTSIAISGSIHSNGAISCFSGSSSSGGAIRLVSNSIIFTGNLSACPPSPYPYCGVIRLEAPTGSLTFTGSSNPPAVMSTTNPIIIPSNIPSLSIVSIGGYSAPSYSGTRFDTVDLLLPNQLIDPINVVIQGNNIPVGAQVRITFSGSPSATFIPGTLQGTLQSSTATLTISNLNRTAATYLFVYATFDPPLTSQNYNPKGRDQVAKVRLESAPGAKSKFAFLRNDGTEIDPKKLPLEFLKEFGMAQ